MARASYLYSMLAGIHQKPTLQHAPDVQDFMTAMREFQDMSMSCDVLGTSLVLASQMYADASIQVVIDISRAMSATATWTVEDLLRGAADIEKLPQIEQGKRRGRAARCMGAHFLRAAAANHDNLLCVGKAVGGWFEVEEIPGLKKLLGTVQSMVLVGG